LPAVTVRGKRLRIFRVGEIENDDRVLAGRVDDRLALVVPQKFLVVPDDQERRGGNRFDTGGCQKRGSAERQ
jgi:hypothetical protein